MTKVVKVRLRPTDIEATALAATLRTCNEAANWLSVRMSAARIYRKHDAQKRFYTELRQQFGLSAQPAIRVIGKVADAYATLHAGVAAGHYGSPGSTRRMKVLETSIQFRIDARNRSTRGACPGRSQTRPVREKLRCPFGLCRDGFATSVSSPPGSI